MKKFVWLLCCWSWLAASAEIAHNLNPFLINLVDMPRYPQYFSIVAENNIVCLVDITWRNTFEQYIKVAKNEIHLIKIVLTGLPTINDHAVFNADFLTNHFTDYFSQEEKIPFQWVPISDFKKTRNLRWKREYKLGSQELNYSRWPDQWKKCFKNLRGLNSTKIEIALEALQKPQAYQEASFNSFVLGPDEPPK
jgi:predicted Zn-dependent protease